MSLYSEHDPSLSSSWTSTDTFDTPQHSMYNDSIDNDTTTPPLDLHRIYAVARARRGNKTRSLSSFTTEWSTATTQTSNTTAKLQSKKNQKRRFILFTKILMRLLERKDPAVFHDAQVVIRDCEVKKKKGETESLVESLRSPLKEVVGPEYWNEARLYSKKSIKAKTTTAHSKTTEFIEEEDDDAMSFATSDMSFVHDGLSGYTSPVSTSPASTEDRIRKRRLWMIICVFMKYLMRSDKELYVKAKDLVSDCVHRHRNGEQAYRSLSGSIQTCLKRAIGTLYWKRAESFVAKALLSKSEEETTMYMEPLPLTTLSSYRKRMDDPNSLKSDNKRRRFYEV